MPQRLAYDAKIEVADYALADRLKQTHIAQSFGLTSASIDEPFGSDIHSVFERETPPLTPDELVSDIKSEVRISHQREMVKLRRRDEARVMTSVIKKRSGNLLSSTQRLRRVEAAYK
jgi:hypothetical protein